MSAPLQPLLHDDIVVLRAPVQVWSARDASMSHGVHGVYAADTRMVRSFGVRVEGVEPEHIATTVVSSDRCRFDFLLRGLDDPTPDPGVRLVLTRAVDAGGWRDDVEIVNRRDAAMSAVVEVRIEPDVTPMDTVKLGAADATTVTTSGFSWGADGLTATLEVEGLGFHTENGIYVFSRQVEVPARSSVRVGWSLGIRDESPVVQGVADAAPWSVPTVRAADDRLSRWVDRAMGDLDALRMSLAGSNDQFVAAGAPWFFTLFGRDSLWTARFLLPLGTDLARDTLRILASLQGTKDDPETAEQPGKILHELRRATVALETGGELPPLYYGTVDATALWILVLHDAWRWGMADDDVRALLPNLRRALAWMRDHGDADGDGLLEYIDASGRGLANQGWKDSGDSVQWRDGTLATGPVALAEVQAYAHEAALGGAALLDAFGEAGAGSGAGSDAGSGAGAGSGSGAGAGGEGDEWRAWAARLAERFRESYWIESDLGRYPAIALDRDKRPVDTLTSNIGHLLGTGILSPDEVELVIGHLTGETLDSGFGLRTMSTQSAGYWPLSYHGGSVWTHDTAIAIRGMAREGRGEAATGLIEGLLRVASGFDYRMPELHSGDAVSDVPLPVPYPAACRPQAWSAAAAVEVLAAVTGVEPQPDGSLHVAPVASFGAVAVGGLVVGGREVAIG